jgi:hypothetical protein
MFRRFALCLACVVFAGGSTIARNRAPISSVAFAASAEGGSRGRPASAGDRGETYYAIEATAVRVSTRFGDNTTAVSERDGKGRIHARLLDIGGNQQTTRELVSGTLDAANAGLKFGRIDRLDTEYGDGLNAVTMHVIDNGEPVVFTRLYENGVDVGRLGYYPQSKRLIWRFPGLTQGMVDEKRLEKHGGWTFAPDMAWNNVQAAAFLRMHRHAKQQAALVKQGVIARLAGFFAPTVHANDPGCDGLHWLDNTVFRPCCDIHDRCYAKNGCAASSWWEMWSSWRCDACNLQVIWCFETVYVALCMGNALYC